MAKKDIEQMDVEAGDEDAGVARIYELAFHLDPDLSESEAKKAYGGYKDLISENGTVVAEGEPEKIQLAYTISRNENAGRRDFTSAYFCWIAYEAMGAGHEAVADAARMDKRIVRFLDIRTDKEAVKHAADMRELREKAPEKQDGDRVSDAELDAALEGASA